MKRGRGRPAKEPNDLIDLRGAVQLIKETLTTKYPPEIANKLCLAPGTLRNKASLGQLHTWRKGKYSFFSKAEILKLVG